jgi:hypothetical protein
VRCETWKERRLALRGAYAIGFRPDHDPDGRVHALRVEPKRKGLSARFAPSYHHGRRPEPGAARTLGALLAGLEEDTLGATIALDPPPTERPAEGPAPVNVRIRVPVTRVSPADDGVGSRRMRVVIATWRGGSPSKDELLDVREQLIDVAPAGSGNDTSLPETREFVIAVPLAAGHAELAVGVLDLASPRVTYRRLRAGPPTTSKH